MGIIKIPFVLFYKKNMTGLKIETNLAYADFNSNQVGQFGRTVLF